MADTLEQLCEPVCLMLSDVDGVLTDGGIIIDNAGIESKHFHVRDGLAVKLWQSAGYRFGLITQRNSRIVEHRALELGVDIVRQGVGDKLTAVQQVLAENGLSPEQTCYVGDDLPDLPVLNWVRFGVAVADACLELREAADYVTTVPGGRGALRETVELILRKQAKWENVVEKYKAR